MAENDSDGDVKDAVSDTVTGAVASAAPAPPPVVEASEPESDDVDKDGDVDKLDEILAIVRDLKAAQDNAVSGDVEAIGETLDPTNDTLPHGVPWTHRGF